MARRLGDRREVQPPRRREGEPRVRSGPSFGAMNISVPISFGLPILVVSLFLLLAASTTGRNVFWVMGIAGMGLGAGLMASGKRL